MTLALHNLAPKSGTRPSKKRVGRGLGSKGTTAGRGQKGQKSRAGAGGLKRLGLRAQLLAIPKVRGFKSMQKKGQAINIAVLDKAFIAGEVVSPRTLAKKGLVASANAPVKLLGDGDISIAVTVKNCAVSAAAAEKITKAGGKIDA